MKFLQTKGLEVSSESRMKELANNLDITPLQLYERLKGLQERGFKASLLITVF
ncbi:MAG: DNA-binding Lrp family transcriptional regulator [Sulfurimonas sp.]|jgi:DNA-binding Lrp family transcriptional regulator